MSDENRKSQIANHKSQNGSRASIAAAEVIKSEKDAAAFVGKSTRTIRRWRAEGKMLMATLDGKPVFLRNQLKLFASNEGRQPTKTRARRDESEADIKQTRAVREKMELDKELGQLVNREEFEKKNIRKILAVKRGIFAMVRTIVAAVPQEHRRAVQKIADKEARFLIEGFSR
jgi:hypothetical protein